MVASSDAILERMMALHPKVIDLTLDRVWRLLDSLGNPERKLPPVIHIAGTNGKGSTQAMVRAGLEAAGLKVHAYTSPHLARFHERIRLAGDLISEEKLTEYLDRCYAANQGEAITYFEITTVAAILAFAETPADYTILEVGLGGRLDATNIVAEPAITAITAVDLDHQQFLGNTLAAIAGEKAGIIKKTRPVVVAKQKDDAMDVIEAKAQGLHAPVLAYGQHWHVSQERDRLVFQDETGLLDLPLPALPGQHQIENAGTALAILRSLGMSDAAFEGAMTNAIWPARMQRLRGTTWNTAHPNAEIWLDGGHNPAAALAIQATLADLSDRDTFVICGMINTKDYVGFLRPILTETTHLFGVTIPGEENAIPAKDIVETAKDLGAEASVAANVKTALTSIKSKSDAPRILICGSLYLAGHILRET